MGRIIGIDYGRKRVGVAVTDPLKMTASGLACVKSHEILPFLENYLTAENVECIVVGMPVKLNNTPSEALPFVQQFIVSLRRKFPGIAVEIIDERFTSKIAVRTMIEGGMKKSERMKKENIDKISAAIILRSFLDKEELK